MYIDEMTQLLRNFFNFSKKKTQKYKTFCDLNLKGKLFEMF